MLSGGHGMREFHEKAIRERGAPAPPIAALPTCDIDDCRPAASEATSTHYLGVHEPAGGVLCTVLLCTRAAPAAHGTIFPGCPTPFYTQEK